MAKISKVKKSLFSEAPDKSLLGALDLGGASTQITYIPELKDSLHHGYNATVTLYGSEYNVYTYSYQCYGLNEAYRRYLAQLVLVSFRIT
jgi:Golgi nucleoside diphosphatase